MPSKEVRHEQTTLAAEIDQIPEYDVGIQRRNSAWTLLDRGRDYNIVLILSGLVTLTAGCRWIP